MKLRAASPRLRVVGCGEAFDTGLGNNSCLLYDGLRGEPAKKPGVPTILFDCGYQVPERLWRLERLYPGLQAIHLTHLHADHVFGVVPLLVRYWEEGRREPLRITGPRGTGSYLRKLLDLGYPGMRARLGFPLEFHEIREGDEWEWRGLRFACARSQHSVLNLAVRVEGAGELDGLSFGVSGDGGMTEGTQALFRGVGVLLQEVYSRDEGIPGHCDLKSLSKFAAESDMKRIGITHVSRNERAAVRAMLGRLRSRAPRRWFELKPGQEIVL